MEPINDDAPDRMLPLSLRTDFYALLNDTGVSSDTLSVIFTVTTSPANAPLATN